MFNSVILQKFVLLYNDLAAEDYVIYFSIQKSSLFHKITSHYILLAPCNGDYSFYIPQCVSFSQDHTILLFQQLIGLCSSSSALSNPSRVAEHCVSFALVFNISSRKIENSTFCGF